MLHQFPLVMFFRVLFVFDLHFYFSKCTLKGLTGITPRFQYCFDPSSCLVQSSHFSNSELDTFASKAFSTSNASGFFRISTILYVNCALRFNATSFSAFAVSILTQAKPQQIVGIGIGPSEEMINMPLQQRVWQQHQDVGKTAKTHNAVFNDDQRYLSRFSLRYHAKKWKFFVYKVDLYTNLRRKPQKTVSQLSIIHDIQFAVEQLRDVYGLQ